MRTLYCAPHASYVVDSDGTLLAVCPPAPRSVPETLNTHDCGDLFKVYPNERRLCGEWLVFLQRLMRASAQIGSTALVPGELRLRSRAFDLVGICS